MPQMMPMMWLSTFSLLLLTINLTYMLIYNIFMMPNLTIIISSPKNFFLKLMW